MEYLLSGMAFAGVIAAQFLAVVFVAHERRQTRSSDVRSSDVPADTWRSDAPIYHGDPGTRKIWLFSE
jgi:hypothetical protein